MFWFRIYVILMTFIISKPNNNLCSCCNRFNSLMDSPEERKALGLFGVAHRSEPPLLKVLQIKQS